MLENKAFCPLPWFSLMTRNNGDIRLCASSNASPCKGLFTKENGEVYNIDIDKVSDSRNSSFVKEVRKTMLEGKDHPACIRCTQEEAAGVKSRREAEIEYNYGQEFFDKALENTKADGTISEENLPLKTIELRLGNRCNIKCRMCNPTESDKWYDDQVKVWGLDHYQDSHGKIQLYQNEKGKWRPEKSGHEWINEDNFLHNLDVDFSQVHLLHIVGGEPLIIEKHYEVLERCIKEGHAKNINIEYNSNVVAIPNRALELWKEFKKVSIGISIDAVGPLNDYIRHPSKWSVIEKNLRKLDSIHDNLHLWFTPTIQIYNILDIPNLIKWKLESNFIQINCAAKAPLLSPHPLHNPKFLNIKILPTDVKKEITSRLRSFYQWLNDWGDQQHEMDVHDINNIKKNAIDMIESYIVFMNSEDLSHLLPKFVKYNKALDNIRDESFSQACPELYELIKDHYDV